MDVWGENYLRPLKRGRDKESSSSLRIRGPSIPRRRSYCLCCHLNDKKKKSLFKWSLLLYLFFPLIPLLSLGLSSKKWSPSTPRFSRKNVLRYMFLFFQQLTTTRKKELKQSNWGVDKRDPRTYPVLTHVEQYLAKQVEKERVVENNTACKKHKKKTLSIHSQWLSDARVLRYLDAYKDPQKAAEKLVETWQWRCTLPNTTNLLRKLHYYVSIGDFRFIGEDQQGYPVVYIHCNSDKFDLEFLSCILETLDTYLDENGAYAGSWVWILDWRKRQPDKSDNHAVIENTKMGSFLDAVKICTKHYPGRLKKAFVVGAHGPLLTLFHMFAHRETKKKVVFLQQVNSTSSEQIEELMSRSHRTEEFNRALANAGFLCSCSNTSSYSDSHHPGKESSTVLLNNFSICLPRKAYCLAIIFTLLSITVLTLIECFGKILNSAQLYPNVPITMISRFKSS
ncbi:hypothetical protein GpartN1_g6611.t1 [Galdieria partita]|uniref:CRAL-TRIO domain-containing protein n=1 Tax=Galdieria partita TaxID=83374 RepID=A0A9C7Q2Q7_9RHOD|nr:hypothetical protein GpartN1_g6611.t1 [Galdieria partita]